MNPQTLQHLVTDSNLTHLADALAPLSEAERRQLSATAYKLYRTYKAGFDAWGFSAWRDQSCSPRRFAAAVVAMLSVCPWSRVKSIPAWGYRDLRPELLLDILTSRKPEWINDWLNLRLADESAPSWQVVRTLIRTGVCNQPESEDYIKAFARILPYPRTCDRLSQASLTERLLGDPDLLQDELWRLFEIETDAFVTYNERSSYYYGKTYENWPTALKTLAERGHIDRQRLLDTSLQALTNGFTPYHLSYLCKFHKFLEPTMAEMAACEALYRQLLSHPVGHVVTFALGMLKTLELAVGLDGKPFLIDVQPVFGMATKRQSTLALQMAKRIVKRQPELKEQAIDVGLQALEHVSSDIHDLACTFLEQNVSREPLIERLACLPPESQSRASGLMAKLGISSVKTSGAACHDHEIVSPPPSNIMDVDVLVDVPQIEPITSLDDLIDAVSHAIEEVDSPDEVERILDGLSRLCDQRPVHFEARTEALLHRILQPPGTSRGLLSAMFPVAQAWRSLLFLWLTTDALPKFHQAPDYWELGPATFIEARLTELTKRVSCRQTGLLLSASTHAHGWIDPVVLVDRVRQVQSEPIQARRFDMIQALLRLAPDRRVEALAQAAELQGEWGTLLRWSLGGAAQPSPSGDIDPAMWIAVGRARSPHASLATDLASLGIKANGPDAIEPAHYDWQGELRQVRHRNDFYPRTSLRIQVTPPVERMGRGSSRFVVASEDHAWLKMLGDLLNAGTSSIAETLEHNFGRLYSRPGESSSYRFRDMPTVALHDWDVYPYAEWEHAQYIKWVATIWPLNPNSVQAMAAQTMMCGIDTSSSAHSDVAFLDTLFVPHRPWSDIAHFMLGVALVHKNADVSGMVVDALIEGIADGRVNSQILAQVLDRLSANQGIKMNRLAATLGEVARISSRHQMVVAQLIQIFLETVAEWPRNSHLLLELLLAAVKELGLTLNVAMREVLEPLKGTNKSAKLARRLLALQPTSDSDGEAMELAHCATAAAS